MSCHLIVFAKAPLPGRAKTRLAPALGEAGAAALAARMLEHTLGEAARAAPRSLEFCACPADEPLLAELAARYGAVLSEQGDGDLGRRMGRAFERALASHRRVLLIGSDCPGLDAAGLSEACAALEWAEAVFRPSTDGGYVLIGLSRYHHRLFSGIPWSTPKVMGITRARLQELGWSAWEGAPLVDIDEPADLSSLPAGW